MPNSSQPPTVVEAIKDGSVATVRFSSERGVNVFSSRVMGDLGNHVQELGEDAHLRFIVFRGHGKTFLAGADIAEMSTFDENQGRALSKHGHHVFDAVEHLPAVTFAAINGHALGGGCELALACDFRIMVAGAKIGQPESQLGLIPGWGGTIRLPKLIGAARARRMLYSGESFTADQALQIGLVDEVVASPEELDGAIGRWFATISRGAPKAITRIKRALLHHDEVREFACCFSCSDANEGMGAFLEKRPPSWMK